jgi:hypothetical protein
MSQTKTKTIKPDPQEEPPYVSGKLAAAAASQRTEAQARAGRNETAAPQEKPDTALRAFDDLTTVLGRAHGILGVIRDGAESDDTDFDNSELAWALSAACDLLDQVHDAAERLLAFRKAVAV